MRPDEGSTHIGVKPAFLTPQKMKSMIESAFIPRVLAPHDSLLPLVTRLLTLVANSQNPHSSAEVSRIKSWVPNGGRQFATSVLVGFGPSCGRIRGAVPGRNMVQGFRRHLGLCCPLQRGQHEEQ